MKRKSNSSSEQGESRKQQKSIHAVLDSVLSDEIVPDLIPIDEDAPDFTPMYEHLPPTLPAHLELLPLIHVISNSYGSLYTLNDPEGVPVWSVYVTRMQFNVPLLEKFCKKTGFFCLRYNFQNQETKVRSLIYSRFETLSEYLGNHPTFIQSPNFKEVMKGIIHSLCVFQESKYEGMCVLQESKEYEDWKITGENLVVLEGTRGALLHMPTQKSNKPGSKKNYTKYFGQLEEVLDGLITTTQVVDRNLLGFKKLLECMAKVSSIEKGWRLLRMPFFLCDQVIVRDFIPTLNAAAQNCEHFKAEMAKCKYDGWKAKVSKCTHKDVKRVFKKVGKYDYTGEDLLRFFRNVVVHADECWQVEMKTKDLSPLLAQPRRFLDFIQSVVPDFIDKAFLTSFEIKTQTIPILDY